MTWAVYLNETPLSSIGVYVMGLGSALSAPSRDFPTLAIPGRQGGLLSADPTTPARTLQLSVTVAPATRTVAARQAAEDALRSLAMRGLVAITVDDDVNEPRVIEGVCTGVELAPSGRAHPVDATVTSGTVTFVCPDPTWRDRTAQVVSLPYNVYVPVPLGTAPTGGIIRIGAPAWSADLTSVSVNYAGISGDPAGGMSFTLALVAGTDYLEIDLDRMTVEKVSSGTRTNAISTMDGGDFFAMDASDGDVLDGIYPLLRSSSYGGTCVASWTGYRRWL